MSENREHPVRQSICSIMAQAPAGVDPFYAVGKDGVTLIEATTKSGMHADIAYIRVWRENVAVAEFCQHQLLGVFFGKMPA